MLLFDIVKKGAAMKTILAVDDSPANLTSVRELLKDMYKVNVVTSGEQALKFLEKKKPIQTYLKRLIREEIYKDE